MNGRAQFYMNLGLTFMLGDFGIVSAIYAEFLKPVYERSYQWIAIDFFALLTLVSLTISLLHKAHSYTTNNRVLENE